MLRELFSVVAEMIDASDASVAGDVLTQEELKTVVAQKTKSSASFLSDVVHKRMAEAHDYKVKWLITTVCKFCRVCVQSARSLNFSGTCNIKSRVFHRLFHSACGKLFHRLRALPMRNGFKGSSEHGTRSRAIDGADHLSTLHLIEDGSGATIADAQASL